MSAHEFGQWLAFYAQEPPAEVMVHHALGLLLAALANGPLRKQDGSLFRSADFLTPPWQPPAPAAAPPASPSLADLRALAQQLAPARPTL